MNKQDLIEVVSNGLRMSSIKGVLTVILSGIPLLLLVGVLQKSGLRTSLKNISPENTSKNSCTTKVGLLILLKAFTLVCSWIS